MVIVDTSVWSLALRRRRNQPNNDASIAELVRLIGEGEALIAGPIRQELLSGVASEEQFVPRWPPQIPPPVAGSNSPTPDGGTIEHFAGDGMMIFFNDPIVLPDAPASAVRMALALRESRPRRIVSHAMQGRSCLEYQPAWKSAGAGAPSPCVPARRARVRPRVRRVSPVGPARSPHAARLWARAHRESGSDAGAVAAPAAAPADADIGKTER